MNVETLELQPSSSFGHDLYAKRWQRTRADEPTLLNAERVNLAPGLLLDRRNEDIFNSDSANTVRAKHAVLAIANPIVNTANMLCTVVVRLGQAAAAASSQDLSRTLGCLKDAALAPVMLGIMQGACMLGVLCPYQGRQWFARAEGHLLYRLAPCFEPLHSAGDPVHFWLLPDKDREQHLLGLRVGPDLW